MPVWRVRAPRRHGIDEGLPRLQHGVGQLVADRIVAHAGVSRCLAVSPGGSRLM